MTPGDEPPMATGSANAPPPAAPGVAIDALSVVVPLYNSEATLAAVVSGLVEVLAPACHRLQLVLVNDGSDDGTDGVARSLVERYPDTVTYVVLSRNFGEHNAVMCGLHHATGDAVAIVDDDLQHPPEEVLALLARLRRGCDVVYGRYARKRHSWLRNAGSRFTNFVTRLLLGKPPRLYLSSFKVINAFTVRNLLSYEGPYPYVDGLILRVTRSIDSVTVAHRPRGQGRSNYTLRRLLALWLNMFTGYSIVPLRIASALGLVMSAAGFLLAVFFVVSWSVGGILLHHEIPPGWASLIVSVVLFGGIQLIVLGMIGEYLGRLFLTQARRPQFVVREVLGPPHRPGT